MPSKDQESLAFVDDGSLKEWANDEDETSCVNSHRDFSFHLRKRTCGIHDIPQ